VLCSFLLIFDKEVIKKKRETLLRISLLVHLSYRLSNYYREPERLRSVSRMVRVVSLIIPWLKNRVTLVRYLDIRGVDYIYMVVCDVFVIKLFKELFLLFWICLVWNL
jgi:hypothetical protein